MSGFTLPDCLVLKFQELEQEQSKCTIDTTVYVLYDKREHKYVVRGKRRWTPKFQSHSYAYDCENIDDLADFLQYIICPYNKVNEILYNYNNLPFTSSEISFDFLNENDHSYYEISGYNNKHFNRKRLLRNLRMLRKVSNEYVN